MRRRGRERQGAEHELERRAFEGTARGGWGGQQLGGHDRLAPGRTLGGRVDVLREAQRSIRHALEAGEARHVDHVRAAIALHDVHAEEVDAERRPAASRQGRQLGRGCKRAALLLVGGAGERGPEHAEQLAADRVDLASRPIRRVVALGEHRLLDRRQRRELGGVRDHRDARSPGAAGRLKDQRAAVQRGQELAHMGRHERLGHGHPRRLEHAKRDDPVPQQRRHGVGIEQRGPGAVQVRRHAHRQVAPVLEHIQVIVEAHPRDVDQVVPEMQRLGRHAPLREQCHGRRDVALVGE